jgi:hypothetical protein
MLHRLDDVFLELPGNGEVSVCTEMLERVNFDRFA